jgi:uncharacterized LabA/DUF88 family protein
VTLPTAPVAAQLRRVYWYGVGSMDEWICRSAVAAGLRAAFVRDAEIRALWMTRASMNNPSLPETELEEAAWNACAADFRDWYAAKGRALEGMRRFYAGVRASSDLIDIREAGHWKVNFLHRLVEEKGLDTTLAVDMVALQDNYDVALVVSGDADAIPSMRHLKERGKHIARWSSSAGRARCARPGLLLALRLHADFVVRIHEQDLLHPGPPQQGGQRLAPPRGEGGPHRLGPSIPTWPERPVFTTCIEMKFCYISGGNSHIP